MVGQRTLNPLIQVRTLAWEPTKPRSGTHVNQQMKRGRVLYLARALSFVV